MKIAAVACLFAVCALGNISAARADVIRSFDVELRLKSDSTLDVTESIVIDFDAQRHGINRFIPVRYDRYGNRYSIWLKVLDVTDDHGHALKYTTSTQGRDTNLRIGDPDVTITGVHTYRIHYLARRAVNFFGDAPEVYWNATGDQWPYPIQTASLRFFPPTGVAPSVVKTKCFVGPPGSTREGQIDRAKDADGYVMFRSGVLQPGEGMTIVAGLPAGAAKAPSWIQELMWFLADWWPAIILPLITGSFLVYKWNTAGRDTGGGEAIAVEWNPPANLSPAEVGTLIDERCDMPDVVSTLVDLAARGYLMIEEIPTTSFLFLSNKDYKFTRRPAPTGGALLPHEKKFLDGLFDEENEENSVQLSELKNEFYVHLPGIRTAIYQSLMDKQYFKSNPQTVRQSYRGIGVLIAVIGVVLSIWGARFGYLAYGIGAIVSGALVIASAGAMPAKTLAGSRTLREVLGFRRFMALVEKDRIAKIANDDPTIFGRLLPYAMVLGVADQWANAFKGLLTQPPDWYRSHNRGPFLPYVFINDLGSGMRTMGNTLASRPSSSAGSGGSGFSGGGSGGGFGGGGGDSW